MSESNAWEWAVRFPGSDTNYMQPDEAAARSLWADAGGTLLRRPASRIRWQVVAPLRQTEEHCGSSCCQCPECDSALPLLLADRGPCSDCDTSMRDCWAQAGSVCCGTCTHPAASTTGLDAGKGEGSSDA